jgi:hypothetical protein
MTNTDKMLLDTLVCLLHTVDCDPNADDSEIMNAIDWHDIRRVVESAQKEDTKINGALCGDIIFCPKGETMWVTAGDASVYIKNGDDGVSVAIHPLNCEMADSLAEAWATHEELAMTVKGEDLE